MGPSKFLEKLGSDVCASHCASPFQSLHHLCSHNSKHIAVSLHLPHHMVIICKLDSWLLVDRDYASLNFLIFNAWHIKVPNKSMWNKWRKSKTALNTHSKILLALTFESNKESCSSKKHSVLWTFWKFWLNFP